MYNVNPIMSDSQFMVMYKMPGFKTERGHYLAPSLEELLRMLNKAEGVNKDTAELLVIHQHLSDGTVLEVLYVDNKPSNVVELRPTRKPCPVTPEEDEEGEGLLKAVKDLLTTAATLSKPVRQGKVRTGFNIIAYPARSGDYVEE